MRQQLQSRGSARAEGSPAARKSGVNAAGSAELWRSAGGWAWRQVTMLHRAGGPHRPHQQGARHHRASCSQRVRHQDLGRKVALAGTITGSIDSGSARVNRQPAATPSGARAREGTSITGPLCRGASRMPSCSPYGERAIDTSGDAATALGRERSLPDAAESRETGCRWPGRSARRFAGMGNGQLRRK